ncbi:MAG: hypothetical protein P1U34_04420 [Coxiellaceae bacterium]|nr:hypothetical protein [Coxiellaceae bacterium]
MKKVFRLCAVVATLGLGLSANLVAAPTPPAAPPAPSVAVPPPTGGQGTRRERQLAGNTRADRQHAAALGAAVNNAAGGSGTSAVSQGASAATGG